MKTFLLMEHIDVCNFREIFFKMLVTTFLFYLLHNIINHNNMNNNND